MAQRRWLSGMDTALVHVERPPVSMNIGALLIFAATDTTFDELLAHIERRLDRIPRFRQRLALAPFGLGRPSWVDDENFDLGFHVRNVGLGGSRDEEALLELFGRLVSIPLDRSRPLWELWVIDLDDGRKAVIQKVHHAMVDGVSDADMLLALLDLTPAPPADAGQPPAEWEPEAAPSDLALARSAIGQGIGRLAGAAGRALDRLRRPARTAKETAHVAQAFTAAAGAVATPAPATSLTSPIGSRRRFEVVRASLDEVKDKKNRHGMTVNDVVLAAVTNGLRDLLLSRGEDLDGAHLRATVPMSVRPAGAGGDLGNQFAPLLVKLPVGEEDPVGRLADLHAQMERMKGSEAVASTDSVFEVFDLVPTSVISVAVRALIGHQRVMDLMITNIPGPPIPLYFMGAELLEIFPYVPLVQHTTVGVAIVSYNGHLNFGLSGDWDTTADLGILADGITKGLGEL